MMMVAKAVTTGHHCGSFQSVQKSQSPANSNLVISAAPATMKMAVIQKTASHVRSMNWYFAFSSSRSSSLRCRSAGAIVAGVDAMLSSYDTIGSFDEMSNSGPDSDLSPGPGPFPKKGRGVKRPFRQP